MAGYGDGENVLGESTMHHVLYSWLFPPPWRQLDGLPVKLLIPRRCVIWLEQLLWMICIMNG